MQHGRTQYAKVSIIIPNFNSKELLKKCLSSIFQNTNYPSFEVIVVDNGSPDDCVSMVRAEFPMVRLLENKTNVGFSKAVNQGIQIAAGDYIIFMGNDQLVPEAVPDWLTKLVSIAESSDSIGFVSPKLIYPNGKIQNYGAFLRPWGGWWKPFYPKLVSFNVQNKPFEELDKPTELDLLQSFLVKRKLLDDIGSFDEGYSPAFNEEFDWCIRAKLAGYKLIYNPKAVLIHHCRFTAKKLGSDWEYFAREKNDLRYLLLNFPILWFVLSAPTFLRQKLSKAWREGRIGQLFRAWLVTIGNLREILSKRRARMKLAVGWGRLFK